MPTYYVFIPNQAITAEVNAPDTRHARTVFLDYLTRNNLLSWRDRQKARREIKVTRIEPGELQTTVQLHYGLEKEPEVELPPPEEQVLTEQESLPKQELEELPPSAEELETQRETRMDTFAGSPIVKLSRQQGQNLTIGLRKRAQVLFSRR